MKMPLLLILLVTSVSAKTWAGDVLSQFDENCRFVYRSAYLELSSDVDGFNKKILSKYEMSSRLASLSLEITTSRANCEHLQADNSAKCNSDYQDLYSTLRGKLNIPAIISGKQSSVDRGPFGSDKAKEKIRLGVIDLQCKK
ncbi:MAG: hypothetical protein H7281_19235 [Bacteriovorax sp.]|nr:hypothetical protein [Bacteriovorax sp.]